MSIDELFKWIGNISSIIGIVTIVPVLMTLYRIIGLEKRRKHELRKASQSPGDHPAIVIIDVLPNIDAQIKVEQFKNTDTTLKSINHDMIFPYEYKEDRQITPEDIPDLIKQIKQIKNKLNKKNHTTVHLFIAAPGALAAMIGAEFSNMGKVIVYQFVNGEYKNWGPLEHRYQR